MENIRSPCCLFTRQLSNLKRVHFSQARKEFLGDTCGDANAFLHIKTRLNNKWNTVETQECTVSVKEKKWKA